MTAPSSPATNPVDPDATIDIPLADPTPAPAPNPATRRPSPRPRPQPAPAAAPQPAPAAPEADEQREEKPGKSAPKRAAEAAGNRLANWRLFVTDPISIKHAWELSNIDPRRIPGDSELLAKAWWWSNNFDRILLFLLVLIVPGFLQGPVLWAAQRPTHRWGMYVVLALVASAVGWL